MCGLAKFHPGFLDSLEALRVDLRQPMKLTSACRCSEHNEAVGGHPKSLHVGDVAMHPGQEGTLGVDVEAADGNYRGELFTKAWKHGFSIGWNAKRKFLHLDRRDLVGLPQQSFDY
jgi:hypothetical protein